MRNEAIKFLKTLSAQQINKLRIMLEHNIICCSGISKDLNYDVEEFNAELRRILL